MTVLRGGGWVTDIIRSPRFPSFALSFSLTRPYKKMIKSERSMEQYMSGVLNVRCLQVTGIRVSADISVSLSMVC